MRLSLIASSIPFLIVAVVSLVIASVVLCNKPPSLTGGSFLPQRKQGSPSLSLTACAACGGLPAPFACIASSLPPLFSHYCNLRLLHMGRNRRLLPVWVINSPPCNLRLLSPQGDVFTRIAHPPTPIIAPPTVKITLFGVILPPSPEGRFLSSHATVGCSTRQGIF